MVENLINGLSGYLQNSVSLAFLAVYMAGVLVSFTPCIYPVVPITLACIGARGVGSKTKGFTLSLIYVSGMAFTYAILGMIAALSGKLFGQIQTNPWTYLVIGNLFLLMGLSMLGVFSLSIRPPRFITALSRGKKGSGIVGSFLTGAVSGMIVGPCTTPALAVVLGYAATKQNVTLAALLMFVFALGMGTLLILVGTFAGLLAGIPKSGAWMVRISKAFGWILVATGEYFLINAGMLWI